MCLFVLINSYYYEVLINLLLMKYINFKKRILRTTKTLTSQMLSHPLPIILFLSFSLGQKKRALIKYKSYRVHF